MFIGLKKKTNQLAVKFNGFVNCFKMLGVFKNAVKALRDDKTNSLASTSLLGFYLKIQNVKAHSETMLQLQI